MSWIDHDLSLYDIEILDLLLLWLYDEAERAALIGDTLLTDEILEQIRTVTREHLSHTLWK